MAIRAACASTNFLTATTWATVDTSVTSGTAATYLASEVNTTTLSITEATNRAASGFTPGAITTGIKYWFNGVPLDTLIPASVSSQTYAAFGTPQLDGQTIVDMVGY